MADNNQGEWMNPLNRMIFHKAVIERKTEVTLRNGMKFSLDYEERKNDGEQGKVWIQFKGAFAPCGWFDVKMLLNVDWISS